MDPDWEYTVHLVFMSQAGLKRVCRTNSRPEFPPEIQASALSCLRSPSIETREGVLLKEITRKLNVEINFTKR